MPACCGYGNFNLEADDDESMLDMVPACYGNFTLDADDDEGVLAGYARELARVLRPGAHAFLHHSNLAAMAGEDGVLADENPHWRDPQVSAEVVAEHSRRHGLQVVVQELVQWGVPFHSDCFTLLRRPLDPTEPDPGTRRIEHPDMNGEMAVARLMTDSYWLTSR